MGQHTRHLSACRQAGNIPQSEGGYPMQAGNGRSWLAVGDAATLPWPAGDRGLVDVGPFVGPFVLAPGGLLAWLGRRSGH
jgi:hypothetical protein